MTSLKEIPSKSANSTSITKLVDLVFVHGLNGNEIDSWYPSNQQDKFWPQWIADDFPQLKVWTLGYAANATKWKTESMPIADVGLTVLDILFNNGLGKRPLAFISHSMGGLVVKQLLIHSQNFAADRYKPIAEKTSGIVFIATPHDGADMANFAKFVSAILLPNEQVSDMTKHSTRLRELHRQFLSYLRNKRIKDKEVICRSYCETRAVRLNSKLPIGVLVVDASSAEPHIDGESAIHLEEDHISICKPESRETHLYGSICSFLRELLDSLESQTPPPPLGYKILTLTDYISIRNTFDNIEKNPSTFPDLVDTGLVDKINKALTEQGIIFIIGPIRFGKTFLLKILNDNLKSTYRLITDITVRVTNKKIESRNDLYYAWFKKIATKIIRNSTPPIAPVHQAALQPWIDDPEIFNIVLQKYRIPLEKGLLNSFIRILDLIPKILCLQLGYLIVFNLDDVQNHTSINAFKELCDDIKLFSDDENEDSCQSIKLVIASRYMPNIHTNKVIITFLPTLNLRAIQRLVMCFQAEMDIELAAKFCDLIYKKTEGYAWFVMRFFQIYLEKRLTGDQQSPIDLGEDIFRNGENWTSDKIFNKNRNSDFIEQLKKLLNEFTEKERKEFFTFIQREGYGFDLNDGYITSETSLIRQSGFCTIDPQSETYSKNGCIVMKEHFTKIAQSL